MTTIGQLIENLVYVFQTFCGKRKPTEGGLKGGRRKMYLYVWRQLTEGFIDFLQCLINGI